MKTIFNGMAKNKLATKLFETNKLRLNMTEGFDCVKQH